MRLFIKYLVLLFPFQALAAPECKEPERWVPEVKFKLDDSSFSETLHLVSGWSYSLKAQIKSQKSSGFPAQICSCNNMVSSKFILDALNAEFSGQNITADQAANFIWQAVQKHFSCASGK